ncbi:MAG TPA: cob(I)yrinic acid a,c-diamide adenosyltransferase [Acetobacteraceae bacterium]|nr:cob(I)yrinic acid a,c-diamide adenosyltransferase [Acetobacteraceae bacterium]
MVKLDRIYTGGGDEGETSLGDGTRVAKTSPMIAALGSVDEANAAIGLVRLHVAAEIDAILERVQNDLFDVGADLCVPTTASRNGLRMTDAQVAWVEHEIDRVNEALPPLDSFVLPGGSVASAHLHMARAIARRAERDCVAVRDPAVSTPALRYLNRLSDFLFVLARHTNDDGRADVSWKPGAHRE